jgi:RNA polymerase sigma-70 factor (ECF subfamily)
VANWRQSQATRWAAAGGSHAQRRFQTLPAPDPPPGEELSEQGETQVLYARAVEIVSREFPEWYRPAFYRVVIGQERPQDVAADLKVRTSAVYNAKARILRRLREEFGDAFE